MHSKPRHIEITGIDLQNSLANGDNFTYDLMDMTIRRGNQMDRNVYGEGVKISWKHTMESDFAVIPISYVNMSIQQILIQTNIVLFREKDVCFR